MRSFTVPKSQQKHLSQTDHVYLSIQKADITDSPKSQPKAKVIDPTARRWALDTVILNVLYQIHSVLWSRVKTFSPSRSGLTRAKHTTMWSSSQRKRNSERPRLSAGNAPQRSPSSRYTVTARGLESDSSQVAEIPPTGAGDQPGDSTLRPCASARRQGYVTNARALERAAPVAARGRRFPARRWHGLGPGLAVPAAPPSARGPSVRHPT